MPRIEPLKREPAARVPSFTPPALSSGQESKVLYDAFNALRPRWLEMNTLPKSLERLETAIVKSIRILEWKDDWDGEGSPAYAEETWQRAALFLVQNALRLWRTCGIAVDVPRIGPGPDGSIDIHWKSERRELLINIPADSRELADYYGDGRSVQVQMMKGMLDTQANNLWLLNWLMQ